MDGTANYNNFSVTTGGVSTAYPYQLNNWQPMNVPNLKCKCPNTKHTQGCSIEPTGDFCEWCSKGCIKRINVVHLKFD